MSSLLVIVLWLSAGALFYIFAGYPLLVAGAAALRRRHVKKAAITPPMTLIIAAYNEADCIEERLANACAADYPRDALEIIVASDGSSDATNDIVAGYRDWRVRLLRLQRAGKIAALNAAVTEAHGDILVFSDANTMVDRRALRELAACFGDSSVGGVVGHTGYRLGAGGESSSLGEDLYWRYDSWLKRMESLTGSVVSAHGGLYAIRRSLYEPPPEGAVTDDFTISTAVIEQGKRLVFEPQARGWEPTAASTEREFQRRVRLMTRGWRAVALRRRLLNPARYGFYSVVLFSHKVARRLAAAPLLALLVASGALVPAHPLYAAMAAAQLAFYSLAMLGFATRRVRIGSAKPLYVPFYFCLANAAGLLALLRFLRGERIALWQPQRTPAGA